MSYKIAVASSDGIHIDETFGAALAFHIFEVTDRRYEQVEIRSVGEDVLISEKAENKSEIKQENGTKESNWPESGCSRKADCGQSGCHGGAGGGCGGSDGASEKVNAISDCRSVVCKKIGFHIQKQLERKAITSFDVACTVEEALDKISAYFSKVDNHQSLRGNIK